MHRQPRDSAQILKLVAAAMILFAPGRACIAAFGIGEIEAQPWSDMAFPSATGAFSAASKTLTASGSPSNDLEIGSQFGPSLSGRHYGTGGTLGGAFSATLSLSGVVIQPNGNVTNGGSLSIIFNGGAPGSLGTDYGIVGGSALLTGTVSAVKLQATGSNTLDVLFHISGGALQNINPSLGTNFSPVGLGLLRFNSPAPLPTDFSSSFTLGSGTTIDVFGAPVPESPYTTWVLFVAIFGIGVVSKRCLAERDEAIMFSKGGGITKINL